MRLDHQKDRNVYVLMGDGECNEGSVWESASFAAEFKLDNMTAIIDINRLRNDGENSTFSNINKFKNIWKSFGWFVLEVDGHDHEALYNVLIESKSIKNYPCVILAKTIKGKGVSFMEGNNDWHHNRITANIYEKIIKEWGQNN